MNRLFTRFPSFLVGIATAATVMVAYSSLFDRVPYKNVTLDGLREYDGNTYVTASFVKTSCQFKDLRVLAYTFGRWKPLPWTDSHTPLGDRIAGRHTLEIYYPSGPYDFVEIRTRHDCDGISVDKLFLEIDNGSRSQKHTEE
jgi:hypothetical protein